MKIKNILLTGATGFVGSYVLESLLNNNFNVKILKRSYSDVWRIKHLENKYAFYNTDEIKLEKIFKLNYYQGIDCIIHCASYYTSEVRTERENIACSVEANLQFPLKLLDLSKQHGVPYFINTSSQFQDLYPNIVYSQTKSVFEKVLTESILKNQIKGISLKLFNPFGPKDRDFKILPSLINSYLKNNPIKLKEPQITKDFTYITDIANAYILTLKSLEEENKYLENNKVLNITTYFPETLGNISCLIKNIINNSTKKEQDRYKIKSSYPSLIGWNIENSLYEGLEKTINYYRQTFNGNN
jgi:nucleoside-diphosphate-sugar epimerase